MDTNELQIMHRFLSFRTLSLHEMQQLMWPHGINTEFFGLSQQISQRLRGFSLILSLRFPITSDGLDNLTVEFGAIWLAGEDCVVFVIPCVFVITDNGCGLIIDVREAVVVEVDGTLNP